MGNRGRKTKYPWPDWTDGEQHTIYRGQDYSIPTINMQISLHGRAKTQSLKVATRSIPGARDGLIFEFYEEDE